MENVKDGYLSTTISNWTDLSKFTHYFSDDLGFIFRGQADSDWKLTPSIERFLRKQPLQLQNDSIYEEQLNKFRESVRGKRQSNIQLSDNELWSLGQHYGLYTPLLDWTYSFHIALYFCFYTENKPESGFRSVFALHKKSIREQMELYNAGKSEYQKLEIIDSLSDENMRIINQAGLFTKTPLGFDIEQWIPKTFTNVTTEAYLLKINIPNSERMRILKELYLMNITPKTIYPDLHGASLDCNYHLNLLADVAKRKFPSWA